MGLSIRVMEKNDVDGVCRLLDKVFGDKSPIFQNWKETIEWLYFSPEIMDRVPRALVIANERSIVGHIGLTLSELTCADQSFTAVHTSNWVVDPDHKVGLLSLRLILEASSVGDVAIVIGGTLDTQRIIPKIGFKRQLDVDRYIKVMKPWPFLRMARSGGQLVRTTGKLMVFLANSLRGRFQGAVKTNGPMLDAQYQRLEVSDPLLDPSRSLGSGTAIDSPPKRNVLRNALSPAFLNWYKQCPQGMVHELRFFSEGALMGQATVLIKSRKGHCYANILNVDANTEDASVWIKILDSLEGFLAEKEITHVNTIGTYEPWCRALQYKGYYKLKSMPFWLRDQSHKLSDIQAWHITAIEGDLGCLFE